MKKLTTNFFAVFALIALQLLRPGPSSRAQVKYLLTLTQYLNLSILCLTLQVCGSMEPKEVILLLKK